LILCVSPYVRYEELERSSALANLVLPEAAALDVLSRHVARLLEQSVDRPARGEAVPVRIEVAAASDDLAGALVDACTRAGHRAQQVDDRSVGEFQIVRNPAPGSTERVLTIWEVPILEPGWADRLERHSLATGPVIALLGFGDRTIVGQARAMGAVACLELPCNLDDLLDAVDRAIRTLHPEAWPAGPRLEQPHVLPPRSRRRSPPDEVQFGAPTWSKSSGGPTIR
jgi:hypothetical protein